MRRRISKTIKMTSYSFKRIAPWNSLRFFTAHGNMLSASSRRGGSICCSLASLSESHESHGFSLLGWCLSSANDLNSKVTMSRIWCQACHLTVDWYSNFLLIWGQWTHPSLEKERPYEQEDVEPEESPSRGLLEKRREEIIPWNQKNDITKWV